MPLRFGVFLIRLCFTGGGIKIKSEVNRTFCKGRSCKIVFIVEPTLFRIQVIGAWARFVGSPIGGGVLAGLRGLSTGRAFQSWTGTTPRAFRKGL